MATRKKVTDVQLLDEKREQLECLKRQCQAVEQLMMVASEEIRYVNHEKIVLKEKLEELQEKCEKTQQKTDKHVRVMQNTSTASDEQLRQKLKNLEQEVLDGKRENALMRQRIEERVERKAKELQQLKDGVESLRQELHTKALQFGVQLKDILLLHA